MAEHRREPRTRALRGGKIVFNYGRSVVDCTVRNLSRHGACLELASLVGVPRPLHPDDGGRSHQAFLPPRLEDGLSRRRRLRGAAAGAARSRRARAPQRIGAARQRATGRPARRAARAACGPRRGGVRRRAARPEPARAIHQPRVPPHLASAGCEGRCEARVRRAHAPRTRGRCLSDPRERARRLHRRACRAREGRQPAAGRSAPRRRCGPALPVHRAAGGRAHARATRR